MRFLITTLSNIGKYASVSTLAFALIESASVCLISGCAADTDEPCVDESCESLDQEAAPSADEPVASDQKAAVFGQYDVGIIPETTACPAGSESIEIHMDDEDNYNQNARGGWIGATVSNTDTTFKFCRIDGRQLWPLSAIDDFTRYYAVLRLGSFCPNGSASFSRTFDNEDHANRNSSHTSGAGGIYPNSSSVSPSTTTLHFCMFQSGSTTMSGFPALGNSSFHYGVFSTPWFGLGQTGFVKTDDEDSTNQNASHPTFLENAALQLKAGWIVSIGVDTTLTMAKVR